MSIELPISLAMFQEVFHTPDTTAIVRILLRWTHFVAGITWIGLLYFFNLVNVPVQKGLDAETKKKVNPDLLGRALWFFRWSAVVTVLAGLTYYAMYILSPAVRNANTLGGGNINVWFLLFAWLTYPIVIFGLEFLIIKKGPGLDEGRAHLRRGHVFTGGVCHVGTRKVLHSDDGRRRSKLGHQSGLFHWHRWRVRHCDAVECLGHHLAE
jgi:hypothetical protein